VRFDRSVPFSSFVEANSGRARQFLAARDNSIDPSVLAANTYPEMELVLESGRLTLIVGPLEYRAPKPF
jgi:hypothetical protein